MKKIKLLLICTIVILISACGKTKTNEIDSMENDTVLSQEESTNTQEELPTVNDNKTQTEIAEDTDKADDSIGKADNTPIDTPIDKVDVKPTEKPEIKPSKPANKPAVKPEDKPLDKTEAKPDVKPEDKPIDKPAEKPIEPEKNILTDKLQTIIDKIYETSQIELPMMMAFMDVTPENSEYYIGSSNIEFKEAVASESMVGSFAHSVVLLRAKAGADIDKIKAEIKNTVNPRKWICVGVEPENVVVDNIDNLIILILSENSDALHKAFLSLNK